MTKKQIDDLQISGWITITSVCLWTADVFWLGYGKWHIFEGREPASAGFGVLIFVLGLFGFLGSAYVTTLTVCEIWVEKLKSQGYKAEFPNTLGHQFKIAVFNLAMTVLSVVAALFICKLIMVQFFAGK
jgi:hypothetical protein